MKFYGANAIIDRYLAVDLETTCLDPAEGSILEVCMKLIRLKKDMPFGYVEEAKFHAYFGALKESHYLQDGMLYNKVNERIVSKLLSIQENVMMREFMKQMLLLCDSRNSYPVAFLAHYAPFDLQWLFEHCLKMYRSSPHVHEWTKRLLVYDTRDVETMLYPALNHSLVPTCQRRGISSEGEAHGAEHDVDQAVKLMVKQLREIHEKHSLKDGPIEYNIEQHLERK